MKSFLLFVAMIVPRFALCAANVRPVIVTQQDHSFVESESCSSFYTQNTTTLASQVNSREHHRISLSGVDVLRIRTTNAGGVSLRGWDHPFGSLVICKCAAAPDPAQASRVLGAVSVALEPGEIEAQGPEMSATQTWWVHLILRVPRSANIDVEVANGGIAVRNMNGRVTARTTNGGISLASCTGRNRVQTENGGISLVRVSGQLNAVTRNGPISLKLHGAAVNTLEAQTEDEIICKLRICTEGWDADHKHLRIGRSDPQIRLTSSSAPILIE